MARLAHSAPRPDRDPQTYGDHVRGAVAGAVQAAEGVARHMSAARRHQFVEAVRDAATFHDLGKLDTDIQARLAKGRNERLRWDHVDAGVAHLLACGAKTAAWLVRAHHAPGLPSCRTGEFHGHTPKAEREKRLRGGRRSDHDLDFRLSQIARTDRHLPELLAAHVQELGTHEPLRGGVRHGLSLRLALSCLVDGDHADSARYEHAWQSPNPPAPRWSERLAALDAYVAGLPKDGRRQADRDAFYRICRHGPAQDAMVSCEGPVGIGKTTAVTAWCLRRAIETGAQRIFIVAPYTTILTQTAKTLRRALSLPGEDAPDDELVAEHHHRADFQALGSRDLATLWRARVVVTTSVQFFETLAACEPSRLRKLHGLPGSVVFLDEAHAVLPAHLWRQNWAWMNELSANWNCSFVFASGSLARVWEHADIVGDGNARQIAEIVPPALAARLKEVERTRIRYRTLGRISDPLEAILAQEGPRLAVFNTVQTAAIVAERLRDRGADVLHLSTALCPKDRDRVLATIADRLDPGNTHGRDWTLVATSLVEAGVDLSFRTSLRERFSTSSLIQIGGRTMRHGGDVIGDVIDFLLDADEEMTAHPGAARSAAVLGQLLAAGRLDQFVDAAALVTEAIRAEVGDAHDGTGEPLRRAEVHNDYPLVASLGRLIDADDTRLVVVDEELKQRLESGQDVRSQELLSGSIQLWSGRALSFALPEVAGRPDVYVWPYDYDPHFLGYMKGALPLLPTRTLIF